MRTDMSRYFGVRMETRQELYEFGLRGFETNDTTDSFIPILVVSNHQTAVGVGALAQGSPS